MNPLLAWFTLKTVPGLGDHMIKRLIGAFKRPERVFNAGDQELYRVCGSKDKLIQAIRSHRTPDSVCREIEAIDRAGYSVITLTDRRYPVLLKEIHDPPPFLYVHGQLPQAVKAIAVVGTRNASHAGLTVTRTLCTDLAQIGFTIVSGMAMGIDTAAHQAAMDSGGKTVAVMGSGFNCIYPKQNRDLFSRIAENGAVLSEFDLDRKPFPGNFPRRNRIISGMSYGTLVTEAGLKSGAMITARMACDQNREVFAVPGDIRSNSHAGTHFLIKQGARLVESAADIIDELMPQTGIGVGPASRCGKKSKGISASALSHDEAMIMQLLEKAPVHADEISRHLSLDVGRLSVLLLNLELSGHILKLPGNTYAERGLT